MRRREFITGIGAAAAWPAEARAQRAGMPVVGYLYPGFPESAAPLLSAFRKGLGETGYVEGRNVAIDYRYAEDRYERLPGLAADLVRRKVAVIATFGLAVFAAKASTTTVPIVFFIGGDPVEQGLAASLNRPGGNLTGVTTLNTELAGKRLGILHSLLPQAMRFAVLVNPNERPSYDSFVKGAQEAAAVMGWQIDVVAASTAGEIDTAFASLAQSKADAALISASALYRDRLVQFAMRAVRHAMPAIYVDRAFAESGGLMSYGSNILNEIRQTGIQAGRILKGEKPADLPVQQTVKIELVINLQTAKILGLAIPPTLLALADEAIE